MSLIYCTDDAILVLVRNVNDFFRLFPANSAFSEWLFTFVNARSAHPCAQLLFNGFSAFCAAQFSRTEIRARDFSRINCGFHLINAFGILYYSAEVFVRLGAEIFCNFPCGAFNKLQQLLLAYCFLLVCVAPVNCKLLFLDLLGAKLYPQGNSLHLPVIEFFPWAFFACIKLNAVIRREQ